VWDTKYVFESLMKYQNKGYTNSHLESVYTILKNENQETVPIIIEEGMTNYSNGSEVYHEAGWDAYVTGCAYVWLMNIIFRDKHEHVFNNTINRVNLMRSVYACMNINGDDPFLFDNCKIYCIRPHKHTSLSEVNIYSIMEEVYLDKIEYTFNIENNSALLIMVKVSNSE
jgi:hypothetical protein